jgi:hypothetical protein
MSVKSGGNLEEDARREMLAFENQKRGSALHQVTSSCFALAVNISGILK